MNDKIKEITRTLNGLKNMANYLYIVANSIIEQDIELKFFSKDQLVLSDFSKKNYSDHVEYFVATQASNHIFDGDRIFQGYSINYDSKTINYSAPVSDEDLLSGLEGCYFSAQRSGDKISICNDYFSQLPIFFFANKECFACSDSLYVLLKLRKALGLSTNTDLQSVKSRAWINSITNQLISDRTPFAAIKYLPPLNYIELNIVNGNPNAKVIPHAPDFGNDGESFEHLTRLAAINIRSVVSSLIHTYPLSLSLSGGLDSRVILASAIHKINSGNLHIGTSETLKRDFEVVKILSEAFSFQYNSRENFLSVKTTSIDQLSTYALLSCGVYDSIYCPKRVPANNLPLPITGHGAELYKGNYGLQSIEAIAEQCPFNRDLFTAEVTRGQEKLHISSSSGEIHYLGYRNALHGARSTIFSLYAIRPLMQKTLSKHFMYPDTEISLAQRKNIVHDLLILLSPALAAIEFDKPEKNITQGYISERLNALGGPIRDDELIQFEITGSPPETGHAISKFFHHLTANDGLTGDLNSQNLSHLLDSCSPVDVPELDAEIAYWKNHYGEINDAPRKESQNIAIGKTLATKILLGKQ